MFDYVRNLFSKLRPGFHSKLPCALERIQFIQLSLSKRRFEVSATVDFYPVIPTAAFVFMQLRLLIYYMCRNSAALA
jgi:hypothetical protein